MSFCSVGNIKAHTYQMVLKMADGKFDLYSFKFQRIQF